MKNPWEEIRLEDYEAHMSLETVQQLQAMNRMMREQFACSAGGSVMILGVAGGNGLEHVAPERFKKIVGVDINPDYLKACEARYPTLRGILQLLCVDLTDRQKELPHADLLVANLLIEYLGYSCFQSVVQRVQPQYVSCAIQVNIDETFVSDSPYLHVFDRLEEVHHQMDAHELKAAMAEIDYTLVWQEAEQLPNGKVLIRLDFEIKDSKTV